MLDQVIFVKLLIRLWMQGGAANKDVLRMIHPYQISLRHFCHVSMKLNLTLIDVEPGVLLHIQIIIILSAVMPQNVVR